MTNTNMTAEEFAKKMEEDITNISTSIRQMLDNSKLSEDTIVLLIANDTKLSKKSIREVLKSIRYLDKTYLKPTTYDEMDIPF